MKKMNKGANAFRHYQDDEGRPNKKQTQRRNQEKSLDAMLRKARHNQHLLRQLETV